MKYSEIELEALEAIQPILRTSPDISSEEFGDFLQYKGSLLARQRIYKNFTDEDGNFTMFEKGTKRDKEALNELSMEIHEYERKMHDTPIFDMLRKEMEARVPDFLSNVDRDSKGRFTEKEINPGWYQNLKGELFHYDGVVWDVVPSERTNELEFLG